VVGAYFDHRLRGAAASAHELDAVSCLCRRYDVRLETDPWEDPVPTEAAARRARYAFLADVARRHAASAVLTGHTADDQVETVLMHAMRGAGLYGLAGIAPRSRWPFRDQMGPSLLRPLLDVLPAIESAAPGARAAILRLSREAQDAVSAIGAVVSPLVTERDDGVALPRAALRALSPDIVPHAYRRAITQLVGDAAEFERRHYRLLSRAHVATTGSAFALPRNIVVTVDADVVVLSVGSLGPPVVDPANAYNVPFSGVLGAWRIHVVRAAAEPDGALLLPDGAVVRARRPGDRVALRGRGHKKLQDYYVDDKIPRRERDAAPVIACGCDVFWTPFGTFPGTPEGAVAGARFRVEGTRLQGRIP
jgi:tRNA(Ile)-lysidine synthase